jgi:tetratricopeptide (TPR) repeat protein
MKKKLIALIFYFFLVAGGCGFGTPEYKDAVLDGASHLNRGKTQEALEDFNRAIDIDPTHHDGYLGRADTLNTMGRYEESLQDYNKAIEIKPTLANAYINRAIAYSHLGQYEKAIADYEKGLELDPEIDDKPSFFKRLFSNDPNTEKGIRKYLEHLKQQAQQKESKS